MRIFAILSVFIFFTVNSFPQSNIFQKIILPDSCRDIGWSKILKTNDKGYIIAANIFIYDSSFQQHQFLVKTDLNGNRVWSKRLESRIYNFSPCVALTDINGPAIIIGTNDSLPGNSNQSLIIMNYQGDIIRIKKICDSCRIRDIKQTLDRGYVMCGYSYKNSNYDLYVTKTDSAGNITWSFTWDNKLYDLGYKVIQTPDSIYYAVGTSTSKYYYDSLFCLLKINQKGSLVWAKKYENVFSGAGSNTLCLFESAENDQLIIGSSYPSRLALIDTAGNILWAKQYFNPVGSEIYSVKHTSDDGFILVGRTGIDYSASYTDTGDVMLIKINSSGDTLWTKSYGKSSDDAGYDVVQADDGGYILTGRTTGFAEDSVGLYFIKTDKYGNSGLFCYEDRPGAMITTPVITYTSVIGVLSDFRDSGQVIIKELQTSMTAKNIVCNPQTRSIIPTIIGFNQNFEIENLPANTGLKIYNMLGQIVYRSENYNNIFPSRVFSSGVYAYYFAFPGGETKRGLFEIIK